VISALIVENLALQRGERVLFRGLGFALAAGSALAITGPNGAGKTSLLRAIAGFIRPLEGAIRFDGAESAADARRAATHLLGHQDGLKNGRTARDELAFQAAWTGAAPGAADAAAAALHLERILDLEVRKLSAGQRRRLALAHLIAAPRALWLLDEPLAPLDAEHRALFGQAMARHLAGGGLIVAAVHDPLPIPAGEVALA
jgi:heme exporter protein A